MKMHVSRRELLALTSFVVPKPTANLEQAHVRMSAWDELGCADLAYEIAELASINKGFDPSAWLDRKPQAVDVTVPVVDFLLKQMEGEMPGAFSEVLRPLQDRLISVRDKTYKLPPSLRPAKGPTESAPDA